jgi:hypothetical protein
MGVAPLLAAVGDHLGVLGVTFDLPAVVVSSALPLTVGTTANQLVGTKAGGLEVLLAITTVTIVHQAAPDQDVGRLL